MAVSNPDEITEKLDAIYGMEPGTLDPAIAQRQAYSLPRDTW